MTEEHYLLLRVIFVLAVPPFYHLPLPTGTYRLLFCLFNSVLWVILVFFFSVTCGSFMEFSLKFRITKIQHMSSKNWARKDSKRWARKGSERWARQGSERWARERGKGTSQGVK